MPAYPDFPTFDSGTAYVKYPEGEYEDPNIKTEFENGWEEIRPRGSDGRHSDLVAIWKLREDAFSTLMTFLRGQRLEANRFFYFHPYLGRALVRYASDKLKWKMVADGHPAWFEVELHMRGQF